MPAWSPIFSEQHGSPRGSTNQDNPNYKSSDESSNGKGK